MRRPGEQPDSIAGTFLAFHGLRCVGDDGSGQYQRYARSDDDGVLFFSGEVVPWHYYCLDGSRGLVVQQCGSLFCALAHLRSRTYRDAT